MVQRDIADLLRDVVSQPVITYEPDDNLTEWLKALYEHHIDLSKPLLRYDEIVLMQRDHILDAVKESMLKYITQEQFNLIFNSLISAPEHGLDHMIEGEQVHIAFCDLIRATVREGNGIDAYQGRGVLLLANPLRKPVTEQTAQTMPACFIGFIRYHSQDPSIQDAIAIITYVAPNGVDAIDPQLDRSYFSTQYAEPQRYHLDGNHGYFAQVVQYQDVTTNGVKSHLRSEILGQLLTPAMVSHIAIVPDSYF